MISCPLCYWFGLLVSLWCTLHYSRLLGLGLYYFARFPTLPLFQFFLCWKNSNLPVTQNEMSAPEETHLLIYPRQKIFQKARQCHVYANKTAGNQHQVS